MNLVDAILFQSRYQPAVPALLTPGACLNLVSYEHLGVITHNVARRARQQGLVRGDTVLLRMNDPLLHVALILGLTRIGVVTLTGSNSPAPSSLRVVACLSDQEPLPPNEARVVAVNPDWLHGDGKPLDDPADDAADEICRLVLTSGTTGEPKAAALTHRRVAFRSMRHQTIFGHRFAACTRLALDMGFSTSMAYNTLFYVLCRGGMLALRGRNPVETLQAFLNFQVEAVVGSPNTFAELVELQRQMPNLFSPFQAMVTIGSTLAPALAERVCSRLGTNFISSYGSTEAGVVATAQASRLVNQEGAVGFVTPDAEIDVIDADGARLPPGETGQLRIRSGVSANGLLDSENRLVPFDPQGYFPGDLGSVTKDGMLILSGRENAVINLGGNKINPERIEHVLSSFSLVRDAAAFSVLAPTGLQELGLAMVWQEGVEIPVARSQLQQHLQGSLPPTYVPKIFMQIDQIPRNSNGKIDRARLQEVADQTVKRMRRASSAKVV